jgi:rubrerythrin
LRRDLGQLQQSVADFSALSVAAMLKKALAYAMRPCSEFIKYEALEILETLQNTARDSKHERQDYYRLAYQMARSKSDLPQEHFQGLVLRLLGNKDHQKVFDAVAKVEKSMAKTLTSRTNQYRSNASPYTYQRPNRATPGIRCFHCNRYGHVWSKCLIRKSESTQSTATGQSNKERQPK